MLTVFSAICDVAQEVIAISIFALATSHLWTCWTCWEKRTRDAGWRPATPINQESLWKSFFAVSPGAERECAEKKDTVINDKNAENDNTSSTSVHLDSIFAAAKSGDMDKAEEGMKKMEQDGHQPPIAAYLSVIKSYMDRGDYDNVNCWYDNLADSNFPMTETSYNSLIRIFSRCPDPSRLDNLLAKMRANGFQPSTRSVFSAYSKLGDAEKCREIFDGISSPGIVNFNAMLNAWAQKGNIQEVELAMEMAPKKNLIPNEISYSTVINACAEGKNLWKAEIWMHRMLEQTDVTPNSVVYNAMIKACVQANNPVRAEYWLGQMFNQEGVELEEISYNMLIHAYARLGHLEKAEMWMRKMHNSGLTPNTISYASVINACARTDNVQAAEDWFEELMRVSTPNSVAFNSMINACAQGRDLGRAIKWITTMQENGIDPDIISFNAILNCCARSKEEAQAEEWFCRMQEAGVKPDEISYNSVINACSSNVHRAEYWFNQMVEKKLPIEIITINMISRAYSNAGYYQRVEDLIAMSKKLGLCPNEHCFASLFAAYANAFPKQRQAAEDVFRDLMGRKLIKVNRPLLINFKKAVGNQRMIEICSDFGLSEFKLSVILMDKPRQSW